MDLRPLATPATPEERAAVDAVLGAEQSSPNATVPLSEAVERRRHLLPVLKAIQSRCGWISPGALGLAARRLHVPPAEAYGVASFYALFALQPRPSAMAHVCDDIACLHRGAGSLCDALTQRLGPAGTQSTGAGWARSPCLGQCDRAPAALIQMAGSQPVEGVIVHATADAITDALARRAVAEPASVVPQQPVDTLRLLRRVGRVVPTDLAAWRASGGGVALQKAFSMGPAGVRAEITASRLAGRGGAAFPTGRKWESVAVQSARPHYVVCNADESEPGTFKDRVLMEGDPFTVIEAVAVAAYATGSEQAYVFVRDEYPLAHTRLAHAIERLQEAGALTDGVGWRVDITLRRGAGAYICGEETALFNAIEGRRGEPRSKPPYPAVSGLFNKPTAVNNVETLCAVLEVLEVGAEAYLRTGTPESTGTRIFCVSGEVQRPGVYELPMGTPLTDLLTLAGAATPHGAMILGGAAGTTVAPTETGIELSFEGARAAGVTLGSGVVLVLPVDAPLLPYLQRIARFFRDESCGQCVPCRVGTVRVEELLARAARGETRATDGELLTELGQAMRDASICGLGQTATSVIEAAERCFHGVTGTGTSEARR